ncbi:MAG: hypothetical protein J6M66_02030 [Lachnospiraceae bacterium]|nr:hypothetical protein [Lachnospiraceae bacterium]
MLHLGPPLMSMDLYLRREKGTVSGVIHDKRAGREGCISGLDQLLLYLDAVISEDPDRLDAGAGKSRAPELPEMSESFARIPAKNVKKLELRVTGCKYRTIQGNIRSVEEGVREVLVFKSDLELLRRIHQLV